MEPTKLNIDDIFNTDISQEDFDTFLKESNVINCLNHGYVRFVDAMGDDQAIINAARVSHGQDGDDERPPEQDKKLINYLWANKHTSPFEHVMFTFEIKCPIVVARQWFRHRTGKYNEISGRYVELPTEYYVPEIEVITRQDTKNHQARTGEQLGNAETVRQLIDDDCANSFATYRTLLAMGCARELARGVLPGFMYTRFYFTIDLHNLAHFLVLRLDKHAQYEIRVYAEAILQFIAPIVPWALEAMKLLTLIELTGEADV